VLPRALNDCRNYYLVPLIKIRQRPLGCEVHLVERGVIAVEIRGIVDGLAVGVIRKQAEAIAKTLSNFHDTTVSKYWNGRCDKTEEPAEQSVRSHDTSPEHLRLQNTAARERVSQYTPANNREKRPTKSPG
jgi:hypothetical protein